MGKGTDGNAKAVSINSANQILANPYIVPTVIFPKGIIADQQVLQKSTFLGQDKISIVFYKETSTKDFVLEIDYINNDNNVIGNQLICNNTTLTTDYAHIFEINPLYPTGIIKLTNLSSATRNIALELTTSSVRDISVSKSKLRKSTTLTSSVGGDGLIVNAESSVVLFDSHKLEECTTAWGLYFFSPNKPTNNFIDYLTIRVEFSNTTTYTDSPGGQLIFRQDFQFSVLDEYNKALVVYSGNDKSSIILAGKYANIPIGKYVRITLINSSTLSSPRIFVCNSVNLIEEGNF